MVTEDRPAPRGTPRPAARRAAFQLGAVALAAVSLSATGFWMFQALRPGDGSPAPAGQDNPPAARLFRLWPKDRKPDLVLALTGEMFGYLQPCGCSSPQYGGLERRYNFLQTLVKDRGWPVVALDLGDVAQRGGSQALLKYVYSMKALRRLGYAAVGIGRTEMGLPLIDALSEYSLNNPSPPVLAANLRKREENFPMMLKTTAVAAPPNAPRVGAVAVVAPSIAKEVRDDMVKFDAVENALGAALNELQTQGTELPVLLFQGSLEEAQKVAARFPQFRVILCVSAEDEPPEKGDRVGQTLVVRVGHKGRCLGAVGVFRTGRADLPFELHYQMVQLGPEYETPAGQDAANPILALLDSYTRDVKAGNFLAHFPRTQHPIQRQFPEATYIGSDKCKRCHTESYDVWKASAHAGAYEALVQAKRPALRQFDGECVVCHVVGFENTGGYADEAKTPRLKNVGCESCHGPGSVHEKAMAASKPNPPGLAALMNPHRTPADETPQARDKRLLRLEESCRKCHDSDNDVHWNIKKWVEGKIVHREPNLRNAGTGAE
jgi:hypothetical protein